MSRQYAQWVRVHGAQPDDDWYATLQPFTPDELARASIHLLDEYTKHVPSLNSIRVACIAIHNEDARQQYLESEVQRIKQICDFKPTEGQRKQVRERLYPRIEAALGKKLRGDHNKTDVGN